MPAGREGSLREVVAVWVVFALVAAEVFCTYARLPVRELYHVSGTGPAAGAGRALVFGNFPIALVALAILPIVVDKLLANSPPRRRRAIVGTALGSAALCCALFWPGVVDQADLDAKWANAVAAVGVGLALALTLAAARAGGLGLPRRVGGDRVRVVFAALLLLLSLPWLLADLGVFVGRVPLLGRVFVSEKLWAPLGQARLHPGVHVGHHHGADGMLLALVAAALSRALPRMRIRPLRTALAAYLALILVYGLANVANDFWFEQLVKRGVTAWSLPSMLLPSLSVAWAILLAVGIAVYWFFFRSLEPGEPARRRRGSVLPAGAVIVAVAALLAVGATRSGAAPARTPLAAAGPTEGGIVFPIAPGGYWHLFVLGGPGSLRRLTDESASDLAPDVSVDGRRIVFQSNRDGNAELYVMRSDGTGVRRVTRDASRDGEPAWSPDGRRIAFVSDRDGNDELYVMRADGTRVRRLTHDAGVDEWPAWSAEGRRLLFDSSRDGTYHLFAVSLGGGRVTRLTDGSADDRYPAPSPDGHGIAFESDRDGSYELYLLGPGGSVVTRLTRGPGDSFAPAWSRDGHELVFLSSRDGNDQVFVTGAHGGAARRLTSGQADKEAPALG
jgi:hypothetical protein